MKKEERIKRKYKEEEHKEKRKWYRITSIGKYTERLKAIIRKEGVRTFRKGGKKLEQKAKERIGKKKEDKIIRKKKEWYTKLIVKIVIKLT